MLEAGKSYQGKKVILIADNPSGTSLKAGLRGIVLTQQTSGSVSVSFNGTAPYGIARAALKLDIQTVEDVKSEIAKLESQLSVLKSTLAYSKEFGENEIDENKVKVWIALEALEGNSSKKHKINIISELF